MASRSSFFSDMAPSVKVAPPSSSPVAATAANENSKTMVVTPEKEALMGSSSSNDDYSAAKNGDMTRMRLQEELNHAKGDAEETLQALLQFAEGVRVITQMMHKATTTEEQEEESKTNDNHDDGDGDVNLSTESPVVRLESLITASCLQGTVFGTDLMRLCDAAQHVQSYAKTIATESSLSAADILQAQQTAQMASKRVQYLERMTRQLHCQNLGLQRQVHKLSRDKKALIQEVKTLRQQHVACRKMEMERLLQQHVVGALLLHEGQLKAVAAQQRLEKQRKAEEEKEEEDDLEMIQAEECQGEEEEQSVVSPVEEDVGKPEEESREAEPTNSNQETCESEANDEEEDKEEVSSSSAATTTEENDSETHATESKTAVEQPKEDSNNTTGGKEAPASSVSLTGAAVAFSKFQAWGSSPSLPQKKEPIVVKTAPPNQVIENETKDTKSSMETNANKENKATAANQADQTTAAPAESTNTMDTDYSKTSDPKKPVGSSLSSSFATVKLFGRVSPPPPPPTTTQPEKPSSTTSIQSVDETTTRQPTANEHVGTKVFNFLFHPEKIHQQPTQTAPRQSQQSSSSSQQQPVSQLVASPQKKTNLNPLLQLVQDYDDDDKSRKVDLDDDAKDGISVDATVPTVAATTPASSCAASRARTLSGGDKAVTVTTTMGNGHTANPTNQHEHQQQQQPVSCIIPHCVSFSDDTLSVQSNLNSPIFQQSPKPGTTSHTLCNADEDLLRAKASQDINMYNDLKVFRSLAIPTDDDIGDYHQYREEQQLVSLQQKPQQEPVE